MRYLSSKELLRAHEELLKRYGGTPGIRDRGLLESAVQRPQMSVFGKPAYPTVFDKAAAVCHSLLFNHPFVDGNKRAAFAACHLTLLFNKRDLRPPSEEIYIFLIKAIENHYDWKEIARWLKRNSKKVKG